MSKSELQTVSLDHQILKQDLIAFLQSTDFGDFNYEGSAINTIIDLLTRNSAYTSFMANMIANESFITSAQVKANVNSHAEKLSHLPKSAISSRIKCNLVVTPSETINLDPFITLTKGSTFLASVGGQSYSFIARDEYFIPRDGDLYRRDDIDLYQGQLLSTTVVYTGEPITIQNDRVDIDSLRVVAEGVESISYNKASTLVELNQDAPVYFLSLDYQNKYRIAFGKDILGTEPAIGTPIRIEYTVVEPRHANGASQLIAVSTIDGYADIQATITNPAYGGSEPEDIETTRFLAPKTYQIQDRALNSVDYGFIVKRDFPFVQSVITWNGEENRPKMYGNVLMSIIGDEDQLLTNSIKQDIVSHLRDYAVGSITPLIVDSKRLDVDITISIGFDPSKTSDSYDTVVSRIRSQIDQMNDDLFNRFGRNLYVSDITQLVMANRGVTNVRVGTTIGRPVDVLRFNNPIYEVDFKNPITRSTIFAQGFITNPLAANHILFDRGDGKLYVSYILNSIEQEEEVGTVDYEQGTLDFTINIQDTIDQFSIEARPANQDIFVDQNYYINISNIEFDRIRNA